MSDQPLVLATRNDAVVTPTLNWGERYNPLSLEMIAALQQELIAWQPIVRRAVILAAAGKDFRGT